MTTLLLDDLSIEWHQDYEIGIEDIDQDHKRLFSIYNYFNTVAEQGTKSPCISTMFVLLSDYAIGHFRNEEAIMNSTKYPDIVNHIRQHNGFVRKLDKIRNRYEGGDDVREELFMFFRDWILLHVLRDDRKIGEHMKKLTPVF